MKVSDLAEGEVASLLKTTGLVIRTGPFCFHLLSPIKGVADGVRFLYQDYPVVPDDNFVDFSISLELGNGFHRWWHPQVRFQYNGTYPFLPLPRDHAYPLLEWSMNWCISTQVHHYLTLHAAVLEKNGSAVVMPAPPGSGKSTLCAALTGNGWRLLSDELALISLDDFMLNPLGRPISLKNDSIDIIRNFIPTASFNEVTHNTSKGTVTHMRIPAEQVDRINEKAKPVWIVFPKFVANAKANLEIRSKADSMLELARNSFNYMVLGRLGFEALSSIISSSDCYNFTYSSLVDAIRIFDQLAQEQE